MPVIDAVKSTIEEYRSTEKFEEFLEEASKIIPESIATVQPEKRTRRRNTNLADFVVEESIGERSNISLY